jgi:hypothetical protein
MVTRKKNSTVESTNYLIFYLVACGFLSVITSVLVYIVAVRTELHATKEAVSVLQTQVITDAERFARVDTRAAAVEHDLREAITAAIKLADKVDALVKVIPLDKNSDPTTQPNINDLPD